MLTVTLFRHAKSSWAAPSFDDFDRPLNKRGERDAPVVGAFLLQQSVVPDLILASPAVRTRQTLTLAFSAVPAAPPTLFENALYHATAPTMLRRLRKVDADKRHVMLVGHNPGLQALALSLTGSGDDAARAALARKFPTAAVAVITFGVGQWRDIRANGGHLQLFVTPKQLRGED